MASNNSLGKNVWNFQTLERKIIKGRRCADFSLSKTKSLMKNKCYQLFLFQKNQEFHRVRSWQHCWFKMSKIKSRKRINMKRTSRVQQRTTRSNQIFYVSVMATLFIVSSHMIFTCSGIHLYVSFSTKSLYYVSNCTWGRLFPRFFLTILNSGQYILDFRKRQERQLS